MDFSVQAEETCRPHKGAWSQILLLCPELSKQWNSKLGEAGTEPASYCPGAGEYPTGDTLRNSHSSFSGGLLPCGPESSVLHLHLTAVCHRWENGGAGCVVTVHIEAGGEERCRALLRWSAVRARAGISSPLGSMVSGSQWSCSAWPFSSLTLLCV